MSRVPHPARDDVRPRGAAWPGVVLRLAGLLAFGAWLWWSQVGLGDTLAALSRLDGRAWGLALAINLLPPLLTAARTRLLLEATGHRVGYPPLAVDTLRAAALNTVTLMGAGDLYRLRRLRILGVPLPTGSLVTILDRAFGIATLVALVLVLQALGFGQAAAIADGWGLAALAAVGLVALGGLLLWPRGRPLAWLRARIAALLPELDAERLRPAGLVRVLLLSLAANLAWVICVGVLGAGLGLALPPLAYLDAAPLVALASLIPITVGGIGLREAGYVVLLGAWGAPAASCIALGLAQYATFLGIACLGGLLFALPEAQARPAPARD